MWHLASLSIGCILKYMKRQEEKWSGNSHLLPEISCSAGQLQAAGRRKLKKD
jgi:hypothetical protein